MAEKTVENFLIAINELHLKAEKTKSEWDKKYQEMPGYALQWADSNLEAVAMIAVVARLVAGITNKENPRDLKWIGNYLMDRIIQEAAHPTRSSSAMASLMAQAELAALAKVYNSYENFKE